MRKIIKQIVMLLSATVFATVLYGINFGNVVNQVKKKVPKRVAAKIDVYEGYKAYFRRVDRGKRKSTKLPKKLQKMLSKHFRKLSKVRAYESNKVNGQNAMTDCQKIYFPANSGMVAKIKNGYFLRKKDNNLQWLLHELQHTQQCNKVGGRRRYANVWFKQVSNTTLIAVNSGRPVNQKSIHDAMPLEKDADRTADRVLARLR